jgi:hypothetical protein
MGWIPMWLREHGKARRGRQFGLTISVLAVTVVMAPSAAGARHRARHAARAGHAKAHRDATPISLPGEPTTEIVLPGEEPTNLSATSGFGDCQIIGRVMCGWKDVSYQNTMWFWCKDGVSCGGNNLTEDNWYYIEAPNGQNAGANDKISSWYNDRDASTIVSKDWLPGPSNNTHCITAFAANPNLLTITWPDGGGDVINDSVSAINLRSGHPC